MLIAKKFKVSGLVQGVYFRASTQARARALNLVGFVRNTSTGEVEGVVCGLPDKVQAFVDWLAEGPPAARVEHVEVSDHPVETWQNFEINV